jgi:hypothetical protein
VTARCVVWIGLGLLAVAATAPAQQEDDRRRIEAVADAARDRDEARAEERRAAERRRLKEVAVRDPATDLLWTRRDNGADLLWPEAVAYCEHLTAGGLTGWALPSIEQLEALYDPAAPADDCETMTCHHRLGIDLSAPWIWSRSEDGEDGAWYLFFRLGRPTSLARFGSATARALCVSRRGGSVRSAPAESRRGAGSTN